jgi:hypothetical protein
MVSKAAFRDPQSERRVTVPALSRDIAVIFRDRSPLDPPGQELIREIETMGADLSPQGLQK